MLINFAIGVATGLVQEFQFGMNWSIYSEFVGDVFGAPLAIEGLAAFMLESTFLGLWIFGWDRLSKRVHLATDLAVRARHVALGVLHHRRQLLDAAPRRLDGQRRPCRVDGRVGAPHEPASRSVAYAHVILVGLTTACVVVFGVACWHLVRGRNEELFRHAAKLALIVGVPVSAFNLWLGSHLGIVITDYQPMKIAATEALWDTEQPASFSLFQIGGFTTDDQTPSFDIEIPYLLSFLATGSFNGEVQGINPLQTTIRAAIRRGGTTSHPCETTYWSMRIMAYLGSARLPRARGRRASLLAQEVRDEAVVPLGRCLHSIPLPYLAALAGWVLTEVGRQPWIVWGLLKTADANSPSVSTHDDRPEPRRLRPSLPGADRPRLRPPAPLCAPRPA